VGVEHVLHAFQFQHEGQFSLADGARNLQQVLGEFLDEIHILAENAHGIAAQTPGRKAGQFDLFDEWFVPATTNTYQGKGQADFVKRIAANNKGVFDDLNSIIQDGKILVTYVPGNHDLAITAANVESVLPGINQARDEMLGLGTYSPVDYPKIAIEHGHRYNFFCAPDPISNQDIAPGTILPPGYFFTRIAVLWVSQGFPSKADTLPKITPNTSGDLSQDLLFRYWKDWAVTLNLYPIKNNFDEKIIVTNINGFEGAYSVNDLLPYQSSPGGEIDVKLYKGIQDNWDTIQTINKVAVHIDTKRAIDSVMAVSEIDRQAGLQYFSNPNSDKRIVVFGHTHVSKIIPSNNYKEQKSIYANSGTWIDNNNGLKTRTFVVITPQDTDESSLTYVKLYNIENGGVQQMAADSLRY